MNGQKNRRSGQMLRPPRTVIWIIIACLIGFAGCASQNGQRTDSLSAEKREEVDEIDMAQADGSLTSMEADLQKDALQHNIKF